MEEKKERIFPDYPKDHKVGMKVPKGGSCCSKCKELSKDNKSCEEKEWIDWNYGDPIIPAPIDSYCCDFFKEKNNIEILKKIKLKDAPNK